MTFKHSKDPRKQNCSFCSKPLINYRDTETQPRTGMRLHSICKQAIDLRRSRQTSTPVSDVYDKLNYVLIYHGKDRRQHIRVYA